MKNWEDKTPQEILSQFEAQESSTGSSKPEWLEVISTGIPNVDMATRIGGFPRGYVTQVSGATYDGKSVVSWHMVAEATKDGGSAAIIDADCSLDPGYAKKVGVNFDVCSIVRPFDGIRTVLDTIAKAVAAEMDVVLLDPIIALPQASNFKFRHLHRMNEIVNGSRTALIITNGYRRDYRSPNESNVMYPDPLIQICQLWLDLERHENVYDKGKNIGHTLKIHVLKNGFGFLPDKPTECYLIYGQGIDMKFSMVEEAIMRGEIIDEGRGWYIYNGNKYHGKAAVREAFEIHPPSCP